MSLQKKIAQRIARRAKRVRSKLKFSPYPRVSVFRSLDNIYAQLINDEKGITLASCSTLELKKQLEKEKSREAKAFAVGQALADKALSLGINQAVFDRGHFLYHGRVKQLAEGLKKGGLKV